MGADSVPKWRHSLEAGLRVNSGGEHDTEGYLRLTHVTEGDSALHVTEG